MRKALSTLTIVSRSEFLPANIAQLAIGVAWSINPALGLSLRLGVLLILSFLVITMAAAWGAQVNTLFDYEEDSRDDRKPNLVQAKGVLRRLGSHILANSFLEENLRW